MAEGQPRQGLSKTTYVMIAVALLGGVLVYKVIKNDEASSAASGTTDGGTEPTADENVSTSTASAPSTLSAWIQQGLASVTSSTYTPTLALNDINDWLAGSCVSAEGYNVIGQLVQTLGAPPGYSTTPTLSVCPAAPFTASSFSGETLVKGGYGVAPGETVASIITDALGNEYQRWDTAGPVPAGDTLVYQPTPGQFTPVTSSTPGGTPLFVKIKSATTTAT